MKKTKLDANNLMPDSELTDEQLSNLMKEVMVDVKKRAALAEKKFQAELKKAMKEAIKKAELL